MIHRLEQAFVITLHPSTTRQVVATTSGCANVDGVLFNWYDWNVCVFTGVLGSVSHEAGEEGVERR